MKSKTKCLLPAVARRWEAKGSCVAAAKDATSQQEDTAWWGFLPAFGWPLFIRQTHG